MTLMASCFVQRTKAAVSCAVMAIAANSSVVEATAWLPAGPDGSYHSSVTSWAEIPFRSVVRQAYDFSCGSAAVATLLDFHYHQAIPEKPIFAAMWQAGDRSVISKRGFSMLDIKRYLDEIGFKTEGFRLTVSQLRQLERPGIIILDLNGYRHFVVVKGIDGDYVVIGDPMLGLTRYRIGDLVPLWNGIFLTIVQSAGQRPEFNIARDMTRRLSPPLTDTVDRDALAQITNFLPPLGQITARTVVQVNRAGTP